MAQGLRRSYDGCLKDEATSYKMQRPSQISLIAHTAKIVPNILRRRIEKKIEDVLGEDQFGFRRGKGTRDAIGMLRIISERTLEIEEELSVCFIDLQQAFDRVNWTKLMQILKETGIDWRERRLISNLYMAQSVKVRLNRRKTRSVKTGRGVRQGCCLSPILFKLYSECLTKEALEGSGDFKIGGQIIHTVKYADDLVLLANKEKVVQNMVDKLIEIGRCYGMEMNVEKTKVMRISRQPSPVKIMLDQSN
jgi:retron-type reverse transcriptase